jgi:hypothetical protein
MWAISIPPSVKKRFAFSEAMPVIFNFPLNFIAQESKKVTTPLFPCIISVGMIICVQPHLTQNQRVHEYLSLNGKLN